MKRTSLKKTSLKRPSRKNVTQADIRLNYNPEKPQARFKAAGLPGALLAKSSDRLPSPVPWPKASAPKPAPLKKKPAPSQDLSQFNGYDAVVVTYTAAEAAALATLFTPGYPTSSWYEDQHDIASYIPLVTGAEAPFNSKSKEDARYYHSLGLYFPCTIGDARVLLIKSGLHLDHDGPAIPFQKLVNEWMQTIQPKIFITTGTGGAIGTDVALGDVCIAGLTQFYCPPIPGKEQFINKTKYPWNADSYKTTPLPAGVLARITPALTSVNAARILHYNPRTVPEIFSAATDAIVTTDFFAFDDSRDTYGLQGRGRVCDMGDAMVGNVMQNYKATGTKWFAIRNASDPQIPNPDNNITKAGDVSNDIYTEYGVFTTAASVIASWAVIDAIIN